MLEPQGLQATREIYTGSLNSDSDRDQWITLKGGEEYALLGVCDEECNDIDLFLYDEKGNEIDSDTASDDVPVVVVNPSRSARYRVHLSMFDCDVEPCLYAVGLYRGGGIVADPDDFQGQADLYLEVAYDALFPDEDRRVDDRLYGNLDASDAETYQIQLESGRPYAILGACDDDCDDMDLILLDGNGNELEADRGEDSFPLVLFSPSYSGAHQVRVEMFECSVEPCFFSVGVYRR